LRAPGATACGATRAPEKEREDSREGERGQQRRRERTPEKEGEDTRERERGHQRTRERTPEKEGGEGETQKSRAGD
jgi:hypothetical protein